ncbi:response regulator transcription factor [Leucobacter weissii]|uniref:Response regulator transcription factor n=1 Tax=Leucobacter weissii TaxID=1983706 RepID=A0A939SB12_9MICO|nr:response regulator transcription factor [Leucobacter weissii]MBO1901015.1 response regulator transcription factor [Leucobacter weissii]
MIVDDQELIRTGFALILGATDGIEVVGEAGDGAEALRVLGELSDRQRDPDVVLMDVRMPGMNGIEATGRLVRQFPRTRVIVLTTFDLDEYAMDAVEAGASGFLLKDARAVELIRAVRAVAEGDAVMAPSVTMRLMQRLRGDGAPEQPAAAPSARTGIPELTEREAEVLGLIAEGLSNLEIGDRLFLSESTVKTHVGRILAKLGLRDRVQAVILAYERGLR